MIKRLKNIINEKGFLLTVVLGLFCLFFFFGDLLKNPNRVYFGAVEDGIQAYYGATYHIKHDSVYWRMNGMNYPYGEQVFFTGCQPFVSNPIKLICTIIDISDYTVGILNVIMLFSVFVCAICLYLIFKHLRLPYGYSAIAAVAISFLSPQIIRLSCHYSLTYQFAIPLFLLLIMKFHESPSLKKSFLISLFVFFMAGTQFYFFGFFALVSAFYWASRFLPKINLHNLKFTATHAFLQIGLPFLLFQVVIFLIDDVHDRTNNPWGYMAYLSNFSGVFYPLREMPYHSMLNHLVKPINPPSLEGYAYIGATAVIIFGFLIIIFLKRIIFFQFKKMYCITENKILNIFFWSAIFALLLSFGYPFIIKGCEGWLQHAGLLKQLRGVARFSWVFYYVINIIAFYKLAAWMAGKKAVLKNIVFAVALLLISYDAYYMSNPIAKALNNEIGELTDKKNVLPENRWLTELDINKYQGIIGLPYCHVGSENVWIAPQTEMIKDVFITSMKTGLPTTMVSLSRTSLSQTYKNLQIIQEPYRRLEIINDLKSKKPFLVLARESELNDNEKRILSECKRLTTTRSFDVYELDLEALNQRCDGLYSNAIKQMNSGKTFIIDGFQYTDSVKTFVYNGFEDRPNINSLKGKGCFEAKFKDYNVVFNDFIPNFKGEREYTVSFWMQNYTSDMFPRTTCVIEGIDSAGKSYNRNEFIVWQKTAIVDSGNALIEATINIKNKKDHLAITMWHYEITDERKMFCLDELFIRPTNETVYKSEDEQSIMYNNRNYLKELK